VAYVPKSTRRQSLLTQLRPHSYEKTIALETGLELQRKHKSMLPRTRTRLMIKIGSKLSLYSHIYFTNTLQTCSENKHLRIIETSIVQTFQSGSSRQDRLHLQERQLAHKNSIFEVTTTESSTARTSDRNTKTRLSSRVSSSKPN
jgi:hypothetical protein